jgi:anaerobic ribonucleoside-triphosphate reductase
MVKKAERQPCQIYSRVTGYLSPTNVWNDAKTAEFANRKTFKMVKTETK